jgi:hypothetical protein
LIIISFESENDFFCRNIIFKTISCFVFKVWISNWFLPVWFIRELEEIFRGYVSYVNWKKSTHWMKCEVRQVFCFCFKCKLKSGMWIRKIFRPLCLKFGLERKFCC